MNESFKPGDVVRLKSSSAPMTVEQVDTIEDRVIVNCVWFVNDSLYRDRFESAALTTVRM